MFQHPGESDAGGGCGEKPELFWGCFVVEHVRFVCCCFFLKNCEISQYCTNSCFKIQIVRLELLHVFTKRWPVYQSMYSLNSGKMNFKLPTACAPDWMNNYQNTNKQNIQFSCFLVELRSYWKVAWQDVFCFSRFNGYPLRDKQICTPNIFVKGKVRKVIALCNRGALETQRKFTQRNSCFCFFPGRYQYTPYKYQLPPENRPFAPKGKDRLPTINF